jgi:hypothetical protein
VPLRLLCVLLNVACAVDIDCGSCGTVRNTQAIAGCRRRFSLQRAKSPLYALVLVIIGAATQIKAKNCHWISKCEDVAFQDRTLITVLSASQGYHEASHIHLLASASIFSACYH